MSFCHFLALKTAENSANLQLFHNRSAWLEHLGSMLKVDVQTFDRSVQLKITGRLVHGDESDLLIQTVDIRTEPSVLIDLSELESVDAAGLGTLVFLQHQLELEGRELVLLSPPEYLLSLLRLTGLEGVLTVRESCPA